jgi:hypothetical protein
MLLILQENRANVKRHEENDFPRLNEVARGSVQWQTANTTTEENDFPRWGDQMTTDRRIKYRLPIPPDALLGRNDPTAAFFAVNRINRAIRAIDATLIPGKAASTAVLENAALANDPHLDRETARVYVSAALGALTARGKVQPEDGGDGLVWRRV